LSAGDHGFESKLGQTKIYKIGFCCSSAKHTAWRGKIDWPELRIQVEWYVYQWTVATVR
jgi:hypothetical protein